MIEFFEHGEKELFNLAIDPGESNNLALTESAKVAELAAALAEWRDRVGARLPVPNPDFDPDRANELGKGGRDN